jgi:uncharacterized protein
VKRYLFVVVAAALVAGCQASAQMATSAQATTPARAVVPQKARPLPLSDVRVTGGPLEHAQDLDGQYLLSLEVDRMMAFLRKSAGLEPKAQGYGGWDGPGRQLTGHIAGHYLSGVSLMYASTGDERFKQRADYLVSELKAVQDKQGDGYIGAQADKDGVDGKIRFQELSRGIIKSGGFDLNGLWSPWYVVHKIFAGLRDAYRYAGNRTALDVEVKYAAWVESIVSPLDDEQTQRMLNTEFGGMNEVLADLYADTGNRRWLALADHFDHRAVVDPLSRREDILAGKHGNTLVPKLLGTLVQYEYTGSQRDGTAAKFFWDQVVLHHSFATGGHGRNEYFGEADKLNDMIEGRTAETCNVYNLIKMARALFALEPDIRYADFHERALFNHILGSIDPSDGAMCYMVPVGQGVSREYQNMTQSFTCCVGSGMESHALHGDGIYYEGPNRLWVNLYVPSVARWRTADATITAETTFPDGDAASLTFTLKTPKTFTLALRRPYWAGAGFSVKVNGTPVANLSAPDTYVEVNRTWKTGDIVALVLPKTLREEPLPDNPNRVALMWGPLVLAGDLGPIQRRHRADEEEDPIPPKSVPALVAAGRPIESWLKPVPGKPATFRTEGVGRDRDVELVPFYELQRRTYSAYWDLYTPAQWKLHAADIRAAQEKQRRLEDATFGFAQPGQMQAERDANYQGEHATPTQASGRFGRRGTGWFSMDVAVDPAQPVTLIVTYAGDERANRTFDILIDGTRLVSQAVERRSPEKNIGFFDIEYKLPAGLTKGKQKVIVRFQATGGNELAAVYGIRAVRTGAER